MQEIKHFDLDELVVELNELIKLVSNYESNIKLQNNVINDLTELCSEKDALINFQLTSLSNNENIIYTLQKQCEKTQSLGIDKFSSTKTVSELEETLYLINEKHLKEKNEWENEILNIKNRTTSEINSLIEDFHRKEIEINERWSHDLKNKEEYIEKLNKVIENLKEEAKNNEVKYETKLKEKTREIDKINLKLHNIATSVTADYYRKKLENYQNETERKIVELTNKLNQYKSSSLNNSSYQSNETRNKPFVTAAKLMNPEEDNDYAANIYRNYPLQNNLQQINVTQSTQDQNSQINQNQQSNKPKIPIKRKLFSLNSMRFLDNA